MADWQQGKRFVAGYGHGVCTVIVGYPFDTIKVRMQSEGSKCGRFSGPLNCLKDTLLKEGFCGLYKGMLAPLMFKGSLNFLAFGIQNIFAQSIVRWKRGPNAANQRPDLTDQIQASILCGAIISVLATPKEGVKARLQVQYDAASTNYRGPLDCAIKVTRSLGLRRGLFRGWGATSLVQMSCFTYFGSYAFITNALAEEVGVDLHAGEQLPVSLTLLAGGLAGCCLWMTVFPLDVIKNRILSAPDVHPPVYRSFLHAARKIYRAEGMRGFYAGFTPCMLRAFPANAAGFAGFELALKLLPD